MLVNPSNKYRAFTPVDLPDRRWPSNAIAAPPKTPPAIIAKLNKAVDEVLESPEAQAHFAAINLRAVGGTPAEATAFIRKETRVWGDVIKAAGVAAN